MLLLAVEWAVVLHEAAAVGDVLRVLLQGCVSCPCPHAGYPMQAAGVAVMKSADQAAGEWSNQQSLRCRMDGLAS